MAAPALTAPRLHQMTSTVIGAGIEVHRTVGSGLLESAYTPCLCYELRDRGLTIETNKEIPLIYKGIRIERSYFADIVVEGAIVVEVKALITVPAVCTQQLLTYLRLLDCRVGLILNFGAETL